MQKFWIALAAVVLFPLSAAADLSGDLRVTTRDPEGKTMTQTGRIYLDGEPDSPRRAMRMELQPEGAPEKMVFLTRPQDEAVYMIMPSSRTYMKMSVEEGREKAPTPPGGGMSPEDFKDVGTERVNGRETVVKEAPIREGEKQVGTVRVYLAPDLKNEPIKSEVRTQEGLTTTTVIENPSTDSVPADLFTLPAGYTEMELPSMSQMMKGMEKGAREEAEKEAQEEALEGVRDKLPF